MGWQLDVTEVRQLAADLQREGGRVGREVSQAVRKRAPELAGRIEDLAPRRTNELAESVTIEYSGDGRSASTSASVGPTASHSRYLEFGTSKMRPRPHSRPALDEVGPRLQDDIERIAGTVLA